MKRTCAGDCCAVFVLPKGSLPRLASGEANGPVDGPFIADMVIPLTRRQARARMRRLGMGWPWLRRRVLKHDFYTCRHWDETTRLCGLYSRRPKMCREYPYGDECVHEGCTCRGKPRKP